MAWPTSRYHADDVVLARLSDTRTWPQSARTFGRRPLPRREPGFGSRRGSYSGGGGGDGGDGGGGGGGGGGVYDTVGAKLAALEASIDTLQLVLLSDALLTNQRQLEHR